MSRWKDTNWNIVTLEDGKSVSGSDALLATCMDIRDELKRLNRLLNCPNFIAIPNLLRDIKAARSKRITKSQAARRRRKP